MIKNIRLLMLLVAIIMLASCSTNSDRETEFTNEGIFCDLPINLFNACDSMYETSGNVTAFTQSFPLQKRLEVLDRIKAKKFCVDTYDGEKTKDAQILKMSSVNQVFFLDMKIPFEDFPEDCYLAYYDADNQIVALDMVSISDDDSEETNVSYIMNGYPSVQEENTLLGMKAFWLAYDKAVRAEIIHPDSMVSLSGQVQSYCSRIYEKLIEESNTDSGDDDSDTDGVEKSKTPVKEGVFGDIPDLFEQQIRFNCQHEFYPPQLRNEEMDKIVTPDKVQKVKDQILNKHIHTIDDDGITNGEAYIGSVQYENHYFSVDIYVPVADENVSIKAEFCDVDGNVLYTSYPTMKPRMGKVVINRGFLSLGVSASYEENLVDDAREVKKVAQVRIVRRNSRK